MNEKLTLATILDPRFKVKFFNRPAVTERVICQVQEKLKPDDDDSGNANQGLEPPPKRACTSLGQGHTTSETSSLSAGVAANVTNFWSH